jgi:hypothetical protein
VTMNEVIISDKLMEDIQEIIIKNNMWYGLGPI